MIAVDTNIVVRFVIDDDPEQTDKAQNVLKTGPVRLLRTVLLETEWVLRSTYRLPRRRVLKILRGVVALPTVEIEDASRVGRALDWFEAGLDFADAMHLAATNTGEMFVTFDQALIRRAAAIGVGIPAQAP